MKPLNPEQLRRMTLAELQKELDNLRTEQYRARVQQTIGQLKDTDSMRQLKRNIARIQTIINEKRREASV
ncbi:MAG: 50S ribosomal protein L29 [Fimbriimonadales bacterium]|nr:MAG: 50S ribosomal protein L29 [Fimbriimonadales bacterium]GIV09235.1 MAG: 50S ribosomal protein L29 [Fimbriimonadales bacterium]